MEPPIPTKSTPKGGGEPPLYALKFISGKYQGGEFPLPAEGEAVIGRSSDLDMVVVEDMVSRRHAKFITRDGELHLEDLGSTNGSFVNGERVSRAQLHEGDRILIGTSILKVTRGGSGASMEEARAGLQQMASGKRTSQVRTMTGSIGEVPLPDLLQLFSASKKTGVLVVTTETQSGRIVLEEGRVVHAVLDGREEVPPVKAFCRILSYNEGTFDMEPPHEGSVPDEIGMSTEGLLMEAMRQLDELRRVQENLPPFSAPIGLTTPLRAKLRDLISDELDVLQAVINGGTIEEALNLLPGHDYEAAEVIERLLRSGYLSAR